MFLFYFIIFSEGLPTEILNELGAKTEEWVDFTLILLRNYLGAYFEEAPRFLSNGDVFTVKGVTFKVMSMYPPFGVVQKHTDVLAVPLLVSHSKVMNRVEVVPLQPSPSSSSSETKRRQQAYEKAIELRRSNEAQFFRSYILPLFVMRRGVPPPTTDPDDLTTRGVHTRVGEVLTTVNGVSFAAVAIDPYDARGGMVTSASMVYCGEQSLQEVKDAYFIMDVSEISRISKWFGRRELENGNVDFFHKFLRVFFKTYPQIAVAGRLVLPRMTARIIRSQREVLHRGLITGNTNIEIQLISTTMMVNNIRFDMLPLFQARLAHIMNELPTDDPRRNHIRRIMETDLPRLQGQDPITIIRSINGLLAEVVSKKGLSAQEIDLFTLSWSYKTPKQGGEQRACPICLVEYEDGQLVRCLRCTHQFHDECIRTWLQNAYECPNCHLPVKGDAGDGALLDSHSSNPSNAARPGADGDIAAIDNGGGFNSNPSTPGDNQVQNLNT